MYWISIEKSLKLKEMETHFINFCLISESCLKDWICSISNHQKEVTSTSNCFHPKHPLVKINAKHQFQEKNKERKRGNVFLLCFKACCSDVRWLQRIWMVCPSRSTSLRLKSLTMQIASMFCSNQNWSFLGLCFCS